MPSFLKAKSANQEKPEATGWGSGFSQRKPLEYGLNEPTPPPTKVEPEPEAQPDVVTPPQAEAPKKPNRGFGLGASLPQRPKKPQPSKHSISDILDPDFDMGQEDLPQPPPTRARTISRDEYSFTPPQSDAPDNWQHLGRRQPEPAPPAPPEQAQPGMEDDAWIDRRFAEHQQERAALRRPMTSHLQPQSRTWKPEFANPNSTSGTTRTCGRCGQKGHIARECPNPMTTRCNFCNVVGHKASECPSKPGDGSRDDRRNGRRDNRREMQRGRNDRESNENASEERLDRDFDRGAAEERYQRTRMDNDARSTDPRQEMLARMRSKGFEDEGEGEEEPEERVLRSRKFRDEEPREKKPGRRNRRDEDEDDDDRPGRRSRRGRDFEDDDDGERFSRKAERKQAKGAEKKAQRAAERAAAHAEAKNTIKLPEFISVQQLSQALGVRYEQFVNRLEDLGYDDVFPGKILNTEVSGLIAMEYDLEPVFDTSVREEEERDLKARPEVDPQDKELLPTRPPVVTIMGHVDHGKTTILDYLRKSSVAAGEAGGITQHIGAFSVPLSASGKTITFLDTPGHAAFLAMRQRGANVTDIVILVVAADDSVKPQTLEAIKHAKGAGVPMLVAINKVDKDGADIQRVKQDLARHGVEIEDFGGDTQVVEVSGKTGQGMDQLEEAAVTLSEILDHRADRDGAVEGWVIEATTKKAGRVATVLVRRGTLRLGSVIVAGNTWARVRSLHNEAGVAISEATPGMPVEVDGWRDQPAAGDEVLQAPTEQKATSVVEYRLEKVEREKTAEDMEAINEARRVAQEKRENEKRAAAEAKRRAAGEEGEDANAKSAAAQADASSGGRIEVPFIIKADVSGSAEAVEAYIMSVSSPMVAPLVLSSSVGAMNESDIELADATQGHIISFNLPPNEGLKMQAEAKGVKVLENNIIYRVLDDVKAVLEERLPPLITQRVLGEAEIGAEFEIGIGGRKKMKIAGCKVRNGVIGHGSRVRVMRGDEKVYDGTISSLKNVKKDVQEMRKGTECGMGFEDWEKFEVGDTIQTYEERSEKRTL